jgi:hypothetical protein
MSGTLLGHKCDSCVNKLVHLIGSVNSVHFPLRDNEMKNIDKVEYLDRGEKSNVEI